jgi:hypothetical protein
MAERTQGDLRCCGIERSIAANPSHRALAMGAEIRRKSKADVRNVRFKGHVIVTDYRFNAGLEAIDFKPRIEDGTNFRDASTGKSTVFGMGPSLRIKSMIKRRVEESREQLKGLEAVDLAKTQSPAGTWMNVYAWVAAIFGITGLLVAAGRHLLDRFRA